MTLNARFWFITLCFDAYWTLAVLGRERVVPALLAGALLALILTSAWQRKWVLAATLLGTAMDALWCYVGAVEFAGQSGVPLWMISLWLTFSCWWYWLFSQIKATPVLLALVGAVAGPLAYLIGWQLGAMTWLMPPYSVLLLMALGWMIYLPVISLPLQRRGTG
ncbi:DUF2878 domain-containing protein [Serratia sp. UGAL515B_01]|uniref:DUF2878 domain-containing protein n=1 Tax=Serratia sp. UGAL515B_01 TaxID=2986763 RepID=UPI00295580B5|nr:DUF2878 domain-containing protein [Serratia sp. UGAL515B_01]WON78265.1 DUF2878 domain-containing protein [Serratia sp. UGAL515B_01]